MPEKRFRVVVAGFSRGVVARELALLIDRKIVMFDKREPMTGKCHTARDESTGVMVHCCGSHILHTDQADACCYVNAFVPFRPYLHRVMVQTARGTFSFQVDGVIAEALDFPADFLKSYASKSKTLPRFTSAFAERIRQHFVCTTQTRRKS